MPNLTRHPPLTLSSDLPIYYRGPDLSLGPLPALIYFALSGEESLYIDPFNQPVAALSQLPIRVFSWDLPFHGPQFELKEAIHKWIEALTHDPHFLDHFIEKSLQNLNDLIENHWIQPSHLAVAGLSRGAFIATSLAAKDPRIETVLGFAPMTQIHFLEEFQALSTHRETIQLSHLVESLIHKSVRFYIGNRDHRVNTDSCFQFIRLLADTAFVKGVRSPPAELIIYPSIGHKGHGTPPEIFQSGVDWMIKKLL